MQRVLALDVGDKRIGVAVSDPLGITAQGVETFERTGSRNQDVSHILQLAERYAPCRLLFGLPRNMDGSYGEQAEKVRSFAEAVLEQFEGEHCFYDERLSTMAARRVLLEADVSRKKRKGVIDKMAAVVILQGYLDGQR
ncbi:MAG: Holliday junction resolvase RuvX [Clostridia bacterium]|nr:Holliday junction resolvase RuvX [Clostridia bacterium]